MISARKLRRSVARLLVSGVLFYGAEFKLLSWGTRSRGNSIPRSSLRCANGIEVARLYSSGCNHSRARYWRKYGCVLDREWCAAESATFSAGRSIGRIGREEGQLSKRLNLVPEFSRLAEAKSFLLLHGGLACFFFQPHRRRRTRASERRSRFLGLFSYAWSKTGQGPIVRRGRRRGWSGARCPDWRGPLA